MYSPTLGRWMQLDPAGFVDGANRYQAFDGRPTSAVDPVGLAPEATNPTTQPQGGLPAGAGFEYWGINNPDVKNNPNYRGFWRDPEIGSNPRGSTDWADYINHDGWGATFKTSLNWVFDASKDKEFKCPCGKGITRTYYAHLELASRVDDIHLSAKMSDDLWSGGTLEGVEIQLDKFKAMARVHELLRSIIWFADFSVPIVVSACIGEDQDADAVLAKERDKLAGERQAFDDKVYNTITSNG
jgi:hypothetical protein